jgi:glutamyl-tRNA reductase
MSPHYTLTGEQVSPVWDKRKPLFIDLAMPRDMEPALGSLEGLTLIGIDKLGAGMAKKHAPADEAAIQGIRHEVLGEFTNWYAFRNYAGPVAAIRQAASADMALGLDAASRNRLGHALSPASQRVLGKLLCALRDALNRRIWEPCLHALETAPLRSSGTGKTHEPIIQGKGTREPL